MFQNRAEIDEYYGKDRIQCLLCFKEFKALGGHLMAIHEIKVAAYQEIFGLPFTRGLTCNTTHNVMSENTHTRMENGEFDESFKKMRATPRGSRSGYKLPPYRVAAAMVALKKGRVTIARRSERRFNQVAPCTHCGNLFNPRTQWKLCQLKKGAGIHCSRRCMRMARRSSVHGASLSREATCPRCGAEFTMTKRQGKRLRAEGKNPYCSNECSFAAIGDAKKAYWRRWRNT